MKAKATHGIWTCIDQDKNYPISATSVMNASDYTVCLKCATRKCHKVGFTRIGGEEKTKTKKKLYPAPNPRTWHHALPKDSMAEGIE